MSWPDVPASEADAPEVLERCYAQVETKMQSMLDGLYEGRLPFLGQRGVSAGGRTLVQGQTDH